MTEGETLVESSRFANILELIETGTEPLTDAIYVANTFSIGDVTWYAPVRRPSKICCLALNNSANSDRILQGPEASGDVHQARERAGRHGGAAVR